jgi:hypothetical protein
MRIACGTYSEDHWLAVRATVTTVVKAAVNPPAEAAASEEESVKEEMEGARRPTDMWRAPSTRTA